MTTTNIKNQVTSETVQAMISTIASVRTDSDTKKGLNYMNLSTMQLLEKHNISPLDFAQLAIQREGDAYTIAQKSFKRAMLMLNGIANKNFSVDFVPFEITASLINYSAFSGKVTGELATAFLSRLIELTDEAQARAGGKMKLKNRDTKGVTTASAQGSSIKGMLRAFGINKSAKNAREVYADIENPLFVEAMTVIANQLKTKELKLHA